ncbi:MAG: CBS domain-containing protein [Actinomadura sp.]
MAEVMTRDLLTITPTESVMMAWELMHQARYHHLPVVDDEGRCLGVLDSQTLAATWETGGPDRARRPVSALLRKHMLATVHPDDRLGTAAKAMLRQESDHVAVTEARGRLVGLLTANDLIATVAGVERAPAADRTATPSLYRIEAVLPEDPEGGHRRRSRISPE